MRAEQSFYFCTALWLILLLTVLTRWSWRCGHVTDRCLAFHVFLLFAVLFLYSVDYVWHFDRLVGGKESWLLYLSMICGMCTVCHGLFALPRGVIDRLYCVFVALSGHLLFYLSWKIESP